MVILPTFVPLPDGGPVVLVLRKAARLLRKRANSPGTEVVAAVAGVIEGILAKRTVAGRENFGRAWTLAERIARFGRSEKLCQWLSLEAWLGMVVDAMLKSKHASNYCPFSTAAPCRWILTILYRASTQA